MTIKPLFLPLLLLCTTGCLAFQTQPATFRPARFGAFLSVSLAKDPTTTRQLHYREQGDVHQPVVVMIHGYGSSSVVWVSLMKVLHKQGYRVLALDLPGFGLSDKRNGDYRTTTLARYVAAFLDKKGIRSAHIVAHSWGSSVALALAVQFPHKVRRLIIQSGWVYSAQIVPVIRWSRIPVVGEMIYGMFYTERPGDKLAHSVYDPERMVTQPVVEQIKASHRRPGAIAAALAVARGMNLHTFEKQYPTIRRPTLLLWGKQDQISLPFYGYRLVADLPQAQMVLIDRCGHLPMLEQPFLVHRYVADFLGPAKTSKKTRLQR